MQKIGFQVREHTLKNGMLVLAIERRSHPVVTSMIWYRVGSRDESTGETGVSHFLEHMLFKGSRNLAKGEIDAITARLGGTNNAFTDYDYTAYYFNFARDRWKTAFAIEADRMQGSVLDENEFEREKNVVLEEMRMGEDEPWRDLAETVSSSVFHVHPYHHPVIGWKHDVSNLSAKRMHDYYYKHYAPDRAVAVVAGDVAASDIFKAAELYFGKLKPSGTVAGEAPEEPRQRGERRIVVMRDSPLRRLMLAFRGTQCGTPHDYALDVLGAALSSGRSSRLYKKLVKEKRLATHVTAENEARRDPGIFWISAEAQNGVTEDRLEELLFSEIEKVKKHKLSDREIARAKRLILAGQAMSQESVSDLADRVGRMAILNTWKYVKNYQSKIEAITSKNIRDAANDIFSECSRTVGWSVPQAKNTKDSAGSRGAVKKHLLNRGRRVAVEPVALPSNSKFKIPARTGNPPIVKIPFVREKLSNGLTILATANASAPTVSMVAYVHIGVACEPESLAGLENLTGSLLEEGTRKYTGDEIAMSVEESGGFLESGSRGVTGTALADSLPLLIEVSAEMLRYPKFDAEAVDRVRNEIMSDLVADEDDLRGRAFRKLRETVYGDHPLHRPADGYIKTVKKLTKKHVQEFHKNWYSPARTIISISGDIDPREAVRRVRKQYESWKAVPAEHPEPCAPPAPRAVEFTDKMEREQVHIALGHIGIRRDNPDFYILSVLDHVLGTGSGFTDRISKRIRDEEGLAYGVNANITNSAGREPGLFVAYLSTEPKNRKHAQKALLREIRRIITDPPTDAEVRDAKDYLIGSYPFTIERNSARALALAAVERYNLGIDYFEKYTEKIESVTRAQVAAAAQTYLFPDRCAVVTVGPV
ncbi:MAG: M16 family metallopeptidase [Planctomycetota bacterium]